MQQKRKKRERERVTLDIRKRPLKSKNRKTVLYFVQKYSADITQMIIE